MKTHLAALLIAASSLTQAQSRFELTTGYHFVQLANLMTRIESGAEPHTDENHGRLMFILGVADGMRNANEAQGVLHVLAKTRPTFVACIPPEVNARQIVMVVKAGLERSPESLHKPYGIYAQAVLLKAFPCPKG